MGARLLTPRSAAQVVFAVLAGGHAGAAEATRREVVAVLAAGAEGRGEQLEKYLQVGTAVGWAVKRSVGRLVWRLVERLVGRSLGRSFAYGALYPPCPG
jgi:hypothetical protein